MSTILIGLLAVASAANAENAPASVSVEGTSITVVPPDGACAYDRANPVDAQVIGLLEKANQGYSSVLLAFVNCKDLEAMHSGKQLPPTDDYGQILSPQGSEQAQDYTRAEVVRKITESYRKDAGVFEKESEKAQEIVKSLTSDSIKISGPKMLGIIKTDPDFVQIGMIQKLQSGDTSIPLVAVITSTKLNVPVSINLYHPYTGEASLNALAERAADYTHKLIALNPDNPHMHASSSFDWNQVLLGGLAGAMIGAIFQIVYKFMKKRRSEP